MSIVHPSNAESSFSELNSTSESSPLLSNNIDHVISSQNAPGSSPITLTFDGDYKKHKSNVLFLCIVFIFLIDFGVFLQLAPLTRILESIVCNSYYDRHPELLRITSTIPEDMCKIPAVQSPVALLKGWFALADCIPGLLLSVPYGIMADKYGRKVVMILSVIGIAMANGWIMLVCYVPDVFPVQLIWLGPAFNIIGGGGIVASSTLLTIIADVFPEDQRSTIFFRVSGTVLVAQLIAIPISSTIMEHSLWTPMFLGEGAVVIAGIVCICIPETLNAQLHSKATLSSSANKQNNDQGEEAHNEIHDLPQGGIFKKLVEATQGFLSEAKAIFDSPGMATIVFTFLFNSIGRSSIDLLLQYTSQRYHWKIAQASRLLSLRVFSQLLLYFVILPAISWVLTKYSSAHASKKDLEISRVSAMLLAIGYLGIGLAANPPILILFTFINALGTGYSIAIRSLATSLTEPTQVGRLFAAIATVDGFGALLAGPALSSLYSWGLGQDSVWSGSPFLLAGLLYVGVTICVWRLKVRD